MVQFRAAKAISQWTISCIFALLIQFALALVHRHFSTSSVLFQLFVSVLVFLAITGIGGWCRMVAGVNASAPAFVVFSILFVWSVYIAVVRPAVSGFMDVLFNGEVGLLLLGLYSMFTRDPGKVTLGPNSSGEVSEGKTETYHLSGRVRFCRTCKAHVKRFDHHCPALGNCIGQQNYVLFVVLIVGFLLTEASFAKCSYQFAAKYQALGRARPDLTLHLDFAVGTMLFSLLQLPWQGLFLAWHVYCICINMTTDEWVHWENYPEFQLLAESGNDPVQDFTIQKFRNPYDKGILQNVKEFLTRKA